MVLLVNTRYARTMLIINLGWIFVHTRESDVLSMHCVSNILGFAWKNWIERRSKTNAKVPNSSKENSAILSILDVGKISKCYSEHKIRHRRVLLQNHFILLMYCRGECRMLALQSIDTNRMFLWRGHLVDLLQYVLGLNASPVTN
jgi:hypothetical protein